MTEYEKRWWGIEPADLSRGIPQCRYVFETEPDHFRHCARRDGHEGPHMDCYGFRHDRLWFIETTVE